MVIMINHCLFLSTRYRTGLNCTSCSENSFDGALEDSVISFSLALSTYILPLCSIPVIGF